MRALPEFPWDSLVPFKTRAGRHPDGIVDLSIGTPVDPTPTVVAEALAAAANSPGYPLTTGAPATRAAIASWAERKLGASDSVGILPTIGTKEFVAWLPTLLGLGAGHRVVIPSLAYPTYDAGARLAGAQVVVADSLTAIGPARTSLLWLNSPSNPTGKVLPADHMAKVVSWARQRGVLVVSDECYFELPWTDRPVSILHPDVSGGDPSGVIALHSLSKRSNLAGYRFGFAVGDPEVIGRLLEVRKHAGMMVPGPIQAAAVAALSDDEHVAAQRAIYGARREMLLAALGEAGVRVDESGAGLYLWATRGESCWDTVAWFAERGILVAPGEFYGRAGALHVRIALTATDERIAAAGHRLAG